MRLGTSVTLEENDQRTSSVSSNVSDEEYEPTSDDDSGQSEEEDGEVELEEEDAFFFVDNGYDPTVWDNWDVDDGGYISKL